MEAATRATATSSHIFTNYLSDRPSQEPFVQAPRAVAARRRAQFVAVWLTSPEEELGEAWSCLLQSSVQGTLRR
jgi:hypothetical protein